MAFPSRGTRKFVVDGQTFLLHPRDPLYSPVPAVVGMEGCRYYLSVWLGVKGGWGELSNVADAIRWALQNGWSPQQGPYRDVVCHENNQFAWAQPEEKRPWCQLMGARVTLWESEKSKASHA